MQTYFLNDKLFLKQTKNHVQCFSIRERARLRSTKIREREKREVDDDKEGGRPWIFDHPVSLVVGLDRLQSWT